MHDDAAIRRVVIVGGGTAGWMTAALLSRALGPALGIRLIESEAIGSVGVGEATIPQIQHVNRFLGIDEDAMLRATGGTFKLAIQFNDWRRIGDSYMHAFGDIGLPLGLLAFQHYWLRDVHGRTSAASAGRAGAADVHGRTSAAGAGRAGAARRAQSDAPDLWAYSINAAAAKANRFARMERVGNSPLTGTRHAFHLDASRYARLLRQQCEGPSVKRTEGRVVDVNLCAPDGFIESVRLDNGECVEGDLFIDCSGFRGLLIGAALNVEYDDWRQWLPCDRAVAVASERVEPMRPYTQASARSCGWQWRIPLQHRNGNGHVYSSGHMSEDEATDVLLRHLDGAALGSPRALRFTTGARRMFWSGNCVAMGLASGFLEPLESTGIHLIQSAVSRLLALFPDRHFAAVLRDEYNRQTRAEYEHIRDFLILHYRATERDDSAFWRQCAQIEMPQSLMRKLELFRGSGQIFREGDELFTEVAWLQVMLGQGIVPQRYHPIADALPQKQMDEFLGNMRTLIARAIAGMPKHDQFVSDHCRASAGH